MKVIAKAYEKKIYIRGTGRAGRFLSYIKMSKTKNAKGDRRSAYYCPIGSDMQMHLLAILDNGNIQLVSTVPGENHDSVGISNPTPGQSEGQEYPLLVLNYRANYGATDAFDRLRALYSCHLFTDRYYRSIMFWAFDTMVINSFLIAKKKGNKYADNLLNYLRRLCWNLSWIREEEIEEKKKQEAKAAESKKRKRGLVVEKTPRVPKKASRSSSSSSTPLSSPSFAKYLTSSNRAFGDLDTLCQCPFGEKFGTVHQDGVRCAACTAKLPDALNKVDTKTNIRCKGCNACLHMECFQSFHEWKMENVGYTCKFEFTK